LKPVLVCFALKEEAGAFQKLAAQHPAVSMLITGMGRENSRRTLLARLKERTPAYVLTCGFAGGLNPRLAIGDVLFSTSDPELLARLTAAHAEPGKFLCASRIATTAAEKAELRRTTGADAVEMESEAFEQVCGERGIRVATVRVISDSAQEDLPLDFNQLSRPDWSLDYGKLAWTVAKSPGKIPALLRLQKNSNRAAARLAEVLVNVIARATGD
jgi:adenosylhomocysteine nucleosidase